MPRSKPSSSFSAPVLTECDHCGKRRRTVVIKVDLPDGPSGLEPHICGQCLAGAMKELDRALHVLLRLLEEAS